MDQEPLLEIILSGWIFWFSSIRNDGVIIEAIESIGLMRKYCGIGLVLTLRHGVDSLDSIIFQGTLCVI